ncbi:hypothetical protein BCR34DRAFT_617384 [Clohesyomyces aquaticus]|uniref:C2H2-type domain-containing protein n=1 Tax=Clohesyomyces aquaticus TaxID=1231657 RepID=A0A1Y1Z3C5_9PLEO|nr:hypothetical protein BCR34DRAFT_617384 [Clohesyomyces aquaticus]
MSLALSGMAEILVAATAQKASHLLQTCREALTDHDTRRVAVAQLSRFDLWASNIGVFASRQSSLDYRLRAALAAKAAIDGNLEILCRHLLTALAGRVSFTDYELDTFAETGVKDVSRFGYKLYDASSKSEDARNVRMSSLQLVEDVIDMLHRLSLAIRKASNRNSLARLPKLVATDTEYTWGKTSEEVLSNSGVFVESVVFEVTGAFEDYVRRLLQSRWLISSPIEGFDHSQIRYREAMLERCVSAISTRRRQLNYFQNHHAKLSKPAVGISEPKSALVQQTDKQVGNTKPSNMLAPIIRNLTNEELKKLPSVSPSETVPSEFNVTSFRPPASIPAPSSAGTGSSIGALGVAGLFEVPPVPELASSEKEKMCPYCCVVYPANTFAPTKRSRRWRKHLIEDLQPYVCLFEKCDQAGKAYWNFKDWQTHLSQAHVYEWVCPLTHEGSDALENEPPVFDTASGFEDHANITHSDLDPARLHTLIRSAGQRAGPPRWCFICLEEHTSDIALQKHVARHLENAFLLALPARDDIKDSDAASSGRPSSDSERSFGKPPSEMGLSDLSDLYAEEVRTESTRETPSLTAEEFKARLAADKTSTVSTQEKTIFLDRWADGQQNEVVDPNEHMNALSSERQVLSRHWRRAIFMVMVVGP